MKYGLINNTRFSMEMMIVVLQLDVKKIQSLLQDIMFKLQSKVPDNDIKRSKRVRKKLNLSCLRRLKVI